MKNQRDMNIHMNTWNTKTTSKNMKRWNGKRRDRHKSYLDCESQTKFTGSKKQISQLKQLSNRNKNNQSEKMRLRGFI